MLYADFVFFYFIFYFRFDDKTEESELQHDFYFETPEPETAVKSLRALDIVFLPE